MSATPNSTSPLNKVDEDVLLNAREAYYEGIMEPTTINLPSLLANLDYPKHFVRKQGPPMGNSPLGHVDFHNTQTKKTMLVNVFGEVLESSKVSSWGNHNPTPFDSATAAPITDKTHVRDVLHLGIPKNATPEIRMRFMNQFVVLNQILLDNEAADQNRRVSIQSSYEWTVPTVAGAPGKAPDALVVSLQRKIAPLKTYQKPSASMAPVASQRNTTKMTLDDLQASETLPSTNMPHEEDTPAQSEGPVIGNFYDPLMMDGCQEGDYQLQTHGLIQKDVRAVDNSLVPCWQVMRFLRPGTLVNVMASLHIYNYKGNAGPNTVKRTYQILAESVKILFDSEAPYVEESQAVDPAIDTGLNVIDAAADFDTVRSNVVAAMRKRNEKKSAIDESELPHKNAHGPEKTPPLSPAFPETSTPTTDDVHMSAAESSSRGRQTRSRRY